MFNPLQRYFALLAALTSLSFATAGGQETVPTASPAEVKADVSGEVGSEAPAAVVPDDRESLAEINETDPVPDDMSTGGGETRLRFSFSYAPWKDVLDWFATQADCSLLMEAPPHGTFNYTDRRSYTPAEAIDVINSVLLTKGFTLVRRERMLILVNLEDGIPPNLVSQVAAEELDERGEFELVSCLFPIQRLTPEEAEAEISKLLGPQGTLVVLPKSGQVMVTETAGKLRAIRKMISAIETPSETGGVKITQLPLQHIGPNEALAVIRQIMGIAEEEFATEDESLRISVDAVGGRLLVKATPDALAEVTDILKLVDVAPDEAPSSGGIETVPQLEVYSISNADPTAVLQVMQTLMAGLPDVRLALDPKTNNLVALARPSQHDTIRATLRQMQQEFSEIEVIQLRVLDPETAKLAVQSLFGITGDEEEGKLTGPRVDANLTTNQLLVRGTSAEIERIKSLLQKMGEPADGQGVESLAERGNIRMLPITGSSAQALLQRAQLVWPAIGRNRIQTVTPSAAVEAMGHRSPALPERSPETRTEGIQLPGQPSGDTPIPVPAERPSPKVLEHNHREPVHAVLSPKTHRVVYLAQATADRSPVAAADVEPPGLPVIVVAPGPGGLLIASEDTKALDQFEQLLETLSDPALSPASDYTVFYLTYAKADTAASLLRTLVGGGSGGEFDSMASGVFGGLLGGGLSDVTEGLSLGVATQIVPDGRINALFVKAEPEDLDLIRQLLQIIDVEHSPENVQTTSPPRLIPVFNANASDVAEVVKQVYASRIASDENRGGGRQGGNNMEELMNAMRRARGGGGNAQQGAPQQEEPPMTIGVDTRSNSIVVSAPEPLFLEVKALVAQLDDVAIASNEVTRVVTITQSNPESIHRALDSLFGAQVSTNRSTQSDRSSSSQRAQGGVPGRQETSSSMQDQIRRRMELFNAFQRARGGGAPGGGRGGAPGGGRGGAPGGGRGGGGPGGGRGGGR